MPLSKDSFYTIDDIYALPDGQRAELIDGQLYNMTPPSRAHQRIVTKLSSAIVQYISMKKGDCDVYVAPFAVFLFHDSKNYVEPDISVVCDKEKLSDRGCEGAPDWIMEITSPSTRARDYGIKLFKYRTAGVKEYWIVNPENQIVNVYDLVHDIATNVYSFDDSIPVNSYPGFQITVSELLA